MPQITSLEDLTSLQRRFEAKFASKFGITGIGIGRNRSKTGLALQVYVRDEKSRSSIPLEFEGIEVVVDVVGNAMAY